jgi:hypothetical protein
VELLLPAGKKVAHGCPAKAILAAARGTRPKAGSSILNANWYYIPSKHHWLLDIKIYKEKYKEKSLTKRRNKVVQWKCLFPKQKG